MVVYMASRAALMKKRSIFLVHRVELLDQAAEAFTSAGVRFGIIAPRFPASNDLIQLASVQTLARRLSKMPAPDLIISDEFHHGVANTWKNIYAHWSESYSVGLTATPVRLNGQGLSDIADVMIVGPSAKELIDSGYLAPYTYYAPPQIANMDGVKVKMGDYDQHQVAEIMNTSVIIGDAVQHYKQLADGKRAITYCASVDHSKHTAAMFRDAGYRAAHLDGETHPVERQRITSDFRDGKLQIITNCDIVSEGYDCPGAEAVILLRPTQSLTLYVQQSMRGMRPDKNNPNKVCTILDHVGNVARHGLPDEDREWTLEGTQKTKRAGKSEFPIRQCPKCYTAHRAGPVCPKCGYLYPVEQRAEIEQVKGELTQVIDIERQKRRQEVGRARSVAELEQIAIARGYSFHWVRKMCEVKHIPMRRKS